MKLGPAPALLFSFAAATMVAAAPPTLDEARALLEQSAAEKDAARAQDFSFIIQMCYQ